MTGYRRAGFDDLRLAEVRADELAARDVAKSRATRVVAACSTGVQDCQELLSMLGLDGMIGRVVIEPSDRPDGRP